MYVCCPCFVHLLIVRMLSVLDPLAFSCEWVNVSAPFVDSEKKLICHQQKKRRKKRVNKTEMFVITLNPYVLVGY